MSQCGKCKLEFVTSDVIASCVDCKTQYHPVCTRIGSNKNFTKAKSKAWKCDVCVDETASVRSNEDVDDKKTILDALSALKQDINANINAKVGAVQDSIESLRSELKDLNNRFLTLESQQNELKTRCDVLERDKMALSNEVRELRMQLQDADQHSRAANIEILGLPLTNSENVYTCLERLAKVINVPFRREDVSIAHRLRLFSKKHAHPPIIAQFVSRSVKETWMSAARSKRAFNASELSSSLPPTPIYINEHLTSSNKTLLGRARRLVREKKLHYAGYFNGKVLIKQREGDAAIRVQSLEDLDQYDKKH